MDLADRVSSGDVQAVARAISLVEGEAPASVSLIGQLYAQTGRAWVVGLTGPPGVGKSSLVDRLTRLWRRDQLKVAVLAVDPSSPFTGGALLGDRIRMQNHTSDAGVFVRSMATRGHLGGLAPATHDAVMVLDAAGFDVVAIETVGVGQGEVDVSRTADISVVITVPGTGDDVQAIKAGIMEIADVFVVNKSDRTGADLAVAEIEAMLSLRSPDTGTRRPPVIKTCAANGDGVDELADTMASVADGVSNRAQRARDRARARLEAILRRRFSHALAGTAAWDEAVDGVAAREVDPYTAADRVARHVLKELSTP